VANAAVDADLADDGQDDVLGGDASLQLSVDPDFHGVRLERSQRLGRQNVFDLGGADADGEGPESAVGGGMAVAADDGLAGLGVAKVRADYVDDALKGTEPVVERDSELGAVAVQGVQLFLGDLVRHREGKVPSGRVVVGGGNGQVQPTHFPAGFPEPVKGLGRGDFVDQVQVDIYDRWLIWFLCDHMVVPDLFEHGLGRHLGLP